MGASGPFPLRALRGSLAADLQGFGMAYFTASDGARIAYEDQGTGMAVLCLAGLTRTMGDFAYALPALAGVRVIRMDYRGRGARDWAGGGSWHLARGVDRAGAGGDGEGPAAGAVPERCRAGNSPSGAGADFRLCGPQSGNQDP